MKTLTNNAASGIVAPWRSFSLTPPRAAQDHAPAALRPACEDEGARALRALREAFRIVGPALLDCVVELTIIVPEEWVLEVIHDLDDQRCACRTLSIANGYYIITAALTLRQSFGYRNRLDLLSQGTASFSMRLSHRSEAQNQMYHEFASSRGL